MWGYRETDRLGGHDPYSNSKGCAELVADAYRSSFFAPGGTCACRDRAGGQRDRRRRLGARPSGARRHARAFMADAALRIRNPSAVRPWQHVLDPVLGYLRLAERLVEGGRAYAEGWNFGPATASEVPVSRVVDALARLWGGSARWEHDAGEHPHEAVYLKLDCAKASARLGWRPLIDLDQALELTVEWYRGLAAGVDMRALTLAQMQRVLRM